MKVLVACEFSGVVREAFRRRGHEAWSCDLLPAEDSSHHHIQADVNWVLNYPDRVLGGMPLWMRKVEWNLMIAFPPCTHLAVSGARWFKDKRKEQEAAIEFARMLIMNCSIPKVAVENPIGVLSSRIRKPDQIIQPWMFGHGETKATCLWLKNLLKLQPTNVVEGRHGRVWREPPGPERWKNRSRTYPGIAEAMAEQWGAS